jgi:hypothetical protein
MKIRPMAAAGTSSTSALDFNMYSDSVIVAAEKLAIGSA